MELGSQSVSQLCLLVCQTESNKELEITPVLSVLKNKSGNLCFCLDQAHCDTAYLVAWMFIYCWPKFCTTTISFSCYCVLSHVKYGNVQAISLNYLDSFISTVFCIRLSDVRSYTETLSITLKRKRKVGRGIGQYSAWVMCWSIRGLVPGSGKRLLYPGVKWLGHEADNWLSSSAKVKNGWSCACAIPMCVHGIHRNNL